MGAALIVAKVLQKMKGGKYRPIAGPRIGDRGGWGGCQRGVSAQYEGMTRCRGAIGAIPGLYLSQLYCPSGHDTSTTGSCVIMLYLVSAFVLCCIMYCRVD